MLAVAHVLGAMLAFFSIAYLFPIAWSIGSGDGAVFDFVIAAAANLVVGLSISLSTRRFRRELKPRDGFVLVTLSWVLMSASATIPLLMALPQLSFTDAYFEAVSGLTTTGSTVLHGLDYLPASINIWRTMLHWLGGIGIIVLAVAILPLLGVGGMQLYKAETPGPVKDEKLTPRITETAKALWLTYLVITLVAIGALKLCGLSWLDSVCHAFSVMALGGFSSHDASIGAFDTPQVEIVLSCLMVLASLSFARHFVALRTLSLQPYLRDSQGKAVIIVLGGSLLFIAALLTISGTYPDYLTSLRHASFNVISVATTTGFSSEDYEQWPLFAPVWMLFLSSVVCSTGSTGGGIKMFRTLLLWRQAARELKQLVHPSAIIPIRIGGDVVPDRIIYSVLAFIFLYFMTVVALTFSLLLTGLDIVSSLSAAVASLNNLGPALGEIGPSTTYESLTDAQTWICTAAMILGRLEIFSVLVLFTPAFWRK
ncbi:MAG: potassium transporter TrkG [Steroidobacteraceae bacterium]